MQTQTLKKLYKLGAIIQIIFAIFVIIFAFPSFLNLGFNADILNWREFTEKVFNSGANLYIKGILHGIIFAIFLMNIFALFVWRGVSNLFFKLSIAVCMFPFAMFSLNFILLCFNVDAGIFYWFSDIILYILFATGAVLFLIGFILTFTTKSRNQSYVIAKAFLWLVLMLFSFVIVAPLQSNWFAVLFSYFGILFPYFLIWMLPVLGIWQLISSFKIGNQQKQKQQTSSQKRPIYNG